MTQLSLWMGAGVLAMGVSAAVVGGADVANADTGAETSSSAADAGPSSKERSPRRAADDAERDPRRTSPARESATSKDDDRDGRDVKGGKDADDDAVADDALSDDDALADADADAETVEAGPPRRSPSSVTLSTRATQNSAPALAPQAEARQQAAPTLSEALSSLLFDTIGVAVTFVAGPPVVHEGSKVTVETSSLEITEGRDIPAHWYYPEGDEPPQRLIFLQHGFLGVSSMYSRTASYLAERTNSVVVVPTHTSNRYVPGGFWLGDDQVHRATAGLFLGGREALTASALSAGYARRYGTDVPLPDRFVLVGHSLGAGVAAGAAGYYADAVAATGEANHLAGVVLLDGAPPQTSLPDALDKLDGLGVYTPVLELGAPKPTRNVDAALNAHRPGRFNGLILADGKHLDAMQGGSSLIQVISYLYQGFPTEPNKSAAQTIVAGWVNDMFAGGIDGATGRCDGAGCVGLYGDFGQTLAIETPAGPTSAAVIGVPAAPATMEFQPAAVASLVAGAFVRI